MDRSMTSNKALKQSVLASGAIAMPFKFRSMIRPGEPRLNSSSRAADAPNNQDRFP
jgi:hypothetical protein